MGEPCLRLEGVVRHYRVTGQTLPVLRCVDLTLEAGEMVALVGPSGSGKSTLLHIAGLLENPDEGQVMVMGEPAQHLDDQRRTLLRRRAIGFIYQFHQLLPEFSALENVMLPQMIDKSPRRLARQRALELLDFVGLSARLDHRPARLSGGEQQRVAIVRAIANRPKILLADEPTGNLDPTTAASVFGEIMRMVKTTGLAAVVATHNLDLAGQMDRIVSLKEGRLVEV